MRLPAAMTVRSTSAAVSMDSAAQQSSFVILHALPAVTPSPSRESWAPIPICETGVKKCDRSCAGASSDAELVGYYESWSYERVCDAWAPENITAGAWTQLNYAFALIGDDYRISQMNTFDADLYPRFTNLKSSTSGLKVFISVGGWAAGGAIFSNMVSSSSSRSTFIDSAISFMATYSFDGKTTSAWELLILMPLDN